MFRAALLLLPLLLAPGEAMAKPCKKLVVDETDAFGARVHGGVVYVDPGHYLALGLRLEEGRLVLESLWVFKGVVETIVPAGTTVELALDDGTVLSGTTAQPAHPVSHANASTVFTQWKLVTPLQTAELARLRTNAVVAARTTLGDSKASFEVPKKRGADLVAVAGCMAP